MDLKMMERVGDRWGKKMEGSCSTGQSPQWAVVPVEEDEEEVHFSYDTYYTDTREDHRGHFSVQFPAIGSKCCEADTCEGRVEMLFC
jgi:hypothetical protein